MLCVYGLSGKYLTFHPQPYQDELFSHWVLRLAHANGQRAQTFADHFFGRQSSFWARDQDKLAADSTAETLSGLTGKPKEDIKGLTLAAYEGVLFQHNNPYGYTRWILPLGRFHRTWRLHGMVYCPLCLFEDGERPYFRRKWRLALTMVCEKHGTLMLDRCHRCEAPVTFFRNDVGRKAKGRIGSSSECHVCGEDLARGPAYDPPAPDGKTLAAMRSLGLAIDLGWWFNDKDALHYGPQYFDGLHHLSMALCSTRQRCLFEEIERRIGKTPIHGTRFTRRIFEMRSIKERYWLIMMALWLLQEWPDRFIETCNASGICRAFLRCGLEVPWWLEEKIRQIG